MENTLIIMQGISGAGKSTFVSRLKECRPLVHCSADFIFLDENGEYHFDPSKLGAGHAECFKKAALTMAQSSCPLVVIDNTNTTLVEMAPYVQAGASFGYRVLFVRLTTPVKVASQRNVHGVPKETVQNMSQRMQYPLKRWASKTHSFEDPTREEVLSWCAEMGIG